MSNCQIIADYEGNIVNYICDKKMLIEGSRYFSIYNSWNDYKTEWKIKIDYDHKIFEMVIFMLNYTKSQNIMEWEDLMVFLDACNYFVIEQKVMDWGCDNIVMPCIQKQIIENRLRKERSGITSNIPAVEKILPSNIIISLVENSTITNKTKIEILQRLPNLRINFDNELKNPQTFEKLCIENSLEIPDFVKTAIEFYENGNQLCAHVYYL